MFRVFLFMLLIIGTSLVLALGPEAVRHIVFPYYSIALIIAAASVVCWLAARAYALKERFDFIEICLDAAEKDLNRWLFIGMDQSGAKDRIPIRQKWAELVPPTPAVLVNTPYVNPVAPMLEMYEKDLMSGKADKRVIGQSAMLYKHIVLGGVLKAQIHIAQMYRENGKLPYVPPGIDELVHLHRFENGKFPRGSGEYWRFVRHVARSRGYPKNLLLVKETPSAKLAIRNMDVLDRLTAHHV